MKSEEENKALFRDSTKTTSLAKTDVVNHLRDWKIKSEKTSECQFCYLEEMADFCVEEVQSN